MIMNKSLLVRVVGCFAFIFILLPAISLAQTRPAGPMGPGNLIEQVHKILSELNLSDDQNTKINAILTQAQADANQIRQQETDPQQRRDKMLDLMDGTKDKIEAELSADQKAEFETKLDDLRKVGAQMMTKRLEQLRKAVGELDLDADQKTKVDALMSDVSQKLEAMKDVKNMRDRMQQFQQIMQNTREQMQTILTPDQLQSLREKMEQQPGNNPPAPAATPPATTQPQTMLDKNHADKSTMTAVTPKILPQATLDTGQPAPDFRLTKLDGSPVQLSSLKGRVIALVFGSYSCPPFRDRAAAINQLAENYSTRATVYLVYTSEANPVGGWEVERNKQEKIAITQPTDEAGRKAMARTARESLHLTLPILVDDMKDTVTTEYSGFPNGAVVINRDGMIAGQQKWAEAGLLKRMIDEAVVKEYHAK